MFDLSPQALAHAVLNVIVLLISLCVHEYSHALMAWKLGDDTAARSGRLTLNPFAHADLFGTILLPLFNSPVGWAKPVPFDPRKFRRSVSMGFGTVLVKVAGPASNVLLALVSAVLFGIGARFAPDLVARQTPGAALLLSLITTNAGLAVFNLIPLHPLDGGAIADYFMPRGLRPVWERISAAGPIVLIALLLIASGTGFLSGPIYTLAEALFRFGGFLAGA